MNQEETKQSWFELECPICHKTFLKRGTYYRRMLKDPKYTNKNSFCSQKCKGAFVGLNYGFSAHPENRRKSSHPPLDRKQKVC
jgi:endogenous inhibitor of DNA gyrase (YacG/DUF329 family)